MGDSLAPKLKKIKVPSGKLVLDPNNPRLVTRDEDRHQEGDYTDNNVQDAVASTLRDLSGEDRYRIKELERSIRQNGWVPVDFIFVKKHEDGEHYVVLEGNRRLAAIRNILNDSNTEAELKDSLAEIDVMEIIDELPQEEVRRKITYLLGVRHHGSLRRWRPFAQAHNIFLRYLRVSGQDDESFLWDPHYGQQVADALSIPLEQVRERLSIYLAMRQVGSHPEIRDSEGGVEDRHYSVCEEVLSKKGSSKLAEYIWQDPDTFLLDDDSIERFDTLCHFSSRNREGAPIRNPAEWGKLEKILREEDDERREQMLEAVENEGRRPSDVWAERAAELQKLQWDKWLLKVNSILKAVALGDDLSSQEASDVARRLVHVIEELDRRDIVGEEHA